MKYFWIAIAVYFSANIANADNCITLLPDVAKNIAQVSYSTKAIDIMSIQLISKDHYLISGFNDIDSMGFEYTVMAASGYVADPLNTSHSAVCNIKSIEKTYEE